MPQTEKNSNSGKIFKAINPQFALRKALAAHPRMLGGRLLPLSAFAVALAANAVFWMPLAYHKPAAEVKRKGKGIMLLCENSFQSPQKKEYFNSWLDNHDTSAFLSYDARGGFNDIFDKSRITKKDEHKIIYPQVPEKTSIDVKITAEVPQLPATASRSVASASRHERSFPLAAQELVADFSRKSADQRTKTTQSERRAAVCDISGNTVDLQQRGVKESSKWILPPYKKNPAATVIRASGSGTLQRIDLVRSCGISDLDDLAIREFAVLMADDNCKNEEFIILWPSPLTDAE
jgi:hypothetical protein